MDKKCKNRWWYLVPSGLILFGIFIIGLSLSTEIIPKPIDASTTRDYEHFSLDIHVKNTNNDRNGLVRVTETLQFDVSVKSKESEKVNLRYYYQVINSGNVVFPRQSNGTIIDPQESVNFTILIPIEKSGINSISLEFQLHEYKEPNPTGGVPSSPKMLEQQVLGYETRVLTQSEYDYQIERAYLYFFMVIPAAPLVIAGMKAFRDIWEYR